MVRRDMTVIARTVASGGTWPVEHRPGHLRRRTIVGRRDVSRSLPGDALGPMRTVMGVVACRWSIYWPQVIPNSRPSRAIERVQSVMDGVLVAV